MKRSRSLAPKRPPRRIQIPRSVAESGFSPAIADRLRRSVTAARNAHAIRTPYVGTANEPIRKSSGCIERSHLPLRNRLVPLRTLPDVPREERHADADRAVGDVEVGPDVRPDVEVEEVRHGAEAEAVDQV